MPRSWIADRMRHFDSSGIRKVFDLAATLKNPINLSIGQPDFEVPEPIRAAAVAAIGQHKSGYAPTQGIAPLREKLQERVVARLGHTDRQVTVTSGTSGGLVLALLALVNPGDEVIVLDPYFVMYRALVEMAGGRLVLLDTYPDFQLDLNRLRDAITARTKAILFNSPANPTGVVADEAQLRALAELAAERDVALVSDEIYSRFCYDAPFRSPAEFNERTIVIDGFSKTYGVTGWRLGYAHGPAEVIGQMIKMQQYTFVCAPQPFQWAAVAALDVDMSAHVAAYRRKRDLVVAGLADDFELARPGGAFYAFPKVPWGTGEQFAAKAVEHELLIIPGGIFSGRDTHVRISYAAPDDVLERGMDVLRKLAKSGPR